MFMRLTGWLAAGLAMLITLTLVVGELTDSGQRRWWAARPLTDSIQRIGQTAEE
jgi:hypothetical protein